MAFNGMKSLNSSFSRTVVEMSDPCGNVLDMDEDPITAEQQFLILTLTKALTPYSNRKQRTWLLNEHILNTLLYTCPSPQRGDNSVAVMCAKGHLCV